MGVQTDGKIVMGGGFTTLDDGFDPWTNGVAPSPVLAATSTTYNWAWLNPLPQGNTLGGVSCPSATLCKAVGDFGTILSWNETTWSAESSGTTNGLSGVDCPSTMLCKAVGDFGMILSWNGTSWSADTSITANFTTYRIYLPLVIR